MIRRRHPLSIPLEQTSLPRQKIWILMVTMLIYVKDILIHPFCCQGLTISNKLTVIVIKIYSHGKKYKTQKNLSTFVTERYEGGHVTANITSFAHAQNGG